MPKLPIVSILTRAEARVLRALTLNTLATVLFQSSPAPRRGCCMRTTSFAAGAAGFNPHPRRGAGAADAIAAAPKDFVVSILTRAEARVLPESRVRRSTCGCFNPHPRRGAGAAHKLECVGCVITVSILTRAEARVLLQPRRRQRITENVSILTRAEARVLLC